MEPSFTPSPINHKGAIRPGQQIGHKTHDDVEGDICHTEALNQKDPGKNQRLCLPEIKGHKGSHDMPNPIKNKVDLVGD